MGNYDPHRPPERVGSGPVANPVLKASVSEPLFQRVQDEAERVGVDVPTFVRQSIIAVIESPRRREDAVAFLRRIDDLENRVKELERLADA